MIERLVSNIKTTIVGSVVFIAGTVLVWAEKASLTEFGGFLAVALGLLFSKDPKKPTAK